MSAIVEAPRCAHEGARWGSCPQDFLCQVRLGGERWGSWETVTVSSCEHPPHAWRSQVGPVWRRRGYETRVIRLADEDAGQ